MAITIQQQPTSPNMANADLLYVVTSPSSSRAQYQFVCDIKDENDILVQRLKQQPNPSNKGVFNIGQVLLTQLEVDPVWKVQAVTGSIQSAKEFKVLFGEEFASASFSNTVLYNGITTANSGSPSVSASNYYYDINGLVEPNSGYWNFQSSSYYNEITVPVTVTGSSQVGLTTSPTTLKVQTGNYHTIALINGNANGIDTSATAQDVYMMQVKAYNDLNGNGALLDTLDIYNITGEGGGPRASEADAWNAALQSGSTRLQYWGVGPQNLNDYTSSFMPTGWQSYTVTWYPQETTNIANENYPLAQYIFNKQTGDCSYNTIRFAWKNELGAWDYYNFTLAESETNSMERIEYRQTFVPFSTTSNSATYDISRRGREQLLNKVTTTKTANTDWLTQTEADWIQELFLSSNVYIQDGINFVPVVIIDSALVAKRNPRTQKNFQYQITYQLANNKRQRQ
jgi:hypothetical protein